MWNWYGSIFTIFLQNSNRGREITGFKICYISFLNCRLFTCKVKVITFTLSYVGPNMISSRVSVCQIPVQRKRGNSDWDPDWFGKWWCVNWIKYILRVSFLCVYMLVQAYQKYAYCKLIKSLLVKCCVLIDSGFAIFWIPAWEMWMRRA